MRLASTFFAAAASIAALAPGAGLGAPVKLTIVHFSDLDRMEEKSGRGGVARLASVIAAERRRGGNVLVTFAGDAISPSLLSGLDRGAHMIALLNRLGLTAMTLGNHEFDFGPEVAQRRIAEASFPVLGANHRDADGEIIDGAKASIMVAAGRFKIGIFGLTTTGTAVKSSPGSVVFRPAVEVAAEQARELRAAGADLVVALAHTDSGEDAALLAKGDVDLLLSGDDHVLRVEYDGRAAFAESGAQADRITVIDLELDEVERPEGKRFVWSPAFRVIDSARVEPDPAVAAAVQGYLDRLSGELDAVVGRTTTALDSRRTTVRGREAAIGNLFADAMRAATQADIAIVNGGGIRGDRTYPPGTALTRRDILGELPFGDKTVVIEVTGSDVIAALENGLSGGGRFPHFSGLRVVYDPNRPPGRRVVEAAHGGEEIRSDATYVLATNDFMARGGDGYGMFANGKRRVDARAGALLTVQVMRYIADRGSVGPRVDGRLRVGL